MSWIFRKLTLFCFWGLVTFSIILAVFASSVGYLLPYLDNYRPQIERNLTQITGYPVSLGPVDGALEGVDPIFSVSDFRLTANGTPAIDIDEVRVRIDTIHSLLTLQPQFTYIRFVSPVISLQETDGQWRLNGAEAKQQVNDEIGLERVLGYLSAQKNFSIQEARLQLHSERLGFHRIAFPEIYLFQKQFESLLTSTFYLDDGKEPFQVNARIEEPLGFLGHYRVNAEITMPVVDLPVSALLSDKIPALKTARFGGNVWLNALVGKEISAQLASTKLQLGFQNGEEYRVSAAANLQLKLDKPSVKLEVQDLTFAETDGTSYAASNLALNWSDLTRRATLSFDQLNLELMNGLARQVLPEEARAYKILSGLAPRGTAKNGRLTLDFNDDEPHFELVTNLASASVEGHNGIPRANNIDAVFGLSDTSGYIDFIGHDSQLAFDELYDDTWLTQSVSGYVRWQKQQDIYLVAGQDLMIERNGANVQGGFRLEVRQDLPDWIALDLHGDNLPVMDRLTYVPPKVLNKDLDQWLEGSFANAGQVDSFDLLIHSNLSDNYDSHVRLQMDVSDLSLTFDKNWPTANKVNGHFELDKSGVLVQVDSAMMQSLPISNLAISVPVVNGKADWLNIKGEMIEDSKNVLSMLSASPLADSVLKPFENWQLAGEINGRFDISIPFSEQLTPKVDLQVDFAQNPLTIGDIGLSLEIDQGQLKYDSENGLLGSEFDATLFGGQSHLTLSSTQSEQGISVLGDLSGEVQPQRIAQWHKFPEAVISQISGTTLYRGKLAVNQSQDGQVDLNIKSDLQGVALSLPAPVGKVSDESKSLEVKLMQHEQDLVVDINYDGLSQGRFLMQSNGFTGGELLLNTTKTMPFAKTIPKGLVIRGELEHLSVSAWQDIMLGLHQELEASKAPETGPPALLSRIDLIIDQLDINTNNQWNNLKIRYDGSQNKTLLVNADEVDFALRDINGQPDLHFGFLSWRFAKEDELSAGDDLNSKPDVNSNGADRAPIAAQDVPNMTLSVDELYLNEKPYGDWQLKVAQQGDTLRIEPISTKLKTGHFNASLFWQDTGLSSNVEFNINTKGKDLAELTGKFSDEAFVSSDSFNIDVALSWHGHPFHFDRETVTGHIKFSAEDGNFSQVDELPAFLKALGIFNIGALSRRLTLDFSDIYEPGLTYDEFNGEMQLKDGVLTTKKPVSIISPTAELYLSGTANIVDETLDETLTATFPISGTLPLAGLIWGTPQLAGLLFITDKLIGDQISKVTSVQYKVKGSFSDPEITPVRYKPKQGKN
ncbi:YhdP family protein [Marinomonas sp. TW1]|uniref:YhdP family protein n=1 Tax=Marinomonas sp. TW1 TaxID=1561203 RepID=UPI0007AFCC6B|nr:YhdP family protein [Marinomonas sp. TW1]KZN13277.1 membrane protein [Marinomonas sp. TW1]